MLVGEIAWHGSFLDPVRSFLEVRGQPLLDLPPNFVFHHSSVLVFHFLGILVYVIEKLALHRRNFLAIFCQHGLPLAQNLGRLPCDRPTQVFGCVVCP